MYCTQCGKKIDQEVRYCPFCGAEQRQKNTDKPEVAEEGGTKVDIPEENIEEETSSYKAEDEQNNAEESEKIEDETNSVGKEAEDTSEEKTDDKSKGSNKEESNHNWDSWRALLGPFYYFQEGLWKKGLLLLSAIFLASSALFNMFPQTSFIWIFLILYIAVFEYMPRKDIERKKQNDEIMWKELPPFFNKDIVAIVAIVVSVLVLFISIDSAGRSRLEKNAEAVGFYSNTVQINAVLVTLITTLDLVLLPKMSNLFSHGKIQEILNVLKKSLHLQLFFSIPLAFGLFTITPKFVPWFFGIRFEFITKTIPLVAPLIVVIPLGIAVGRQYLVPMNRVKVYNMAVINGAVVSVIANFVLIPMVGVYGAIIATILAELFVTVTRMYAFIRETHFKFDIPMIVKCVASGVIMYLVTSWITLSWTASIKTTMVQVIVGIVIYMVLMTSLKANPLYELVKSRGKSLLS